ncbi:MAG TPA: hypothetical protein VFZ32_00795 [Micromonosporaceae bacterium]
MSPTVPAFGPPWTPPGPPSYLVPPGPATSLSARLRQRWALVLVTLLGGLVSVNALVEPWLSTTLIVSPVKSDSTEYGVERSGILGIGFAVGLILVLILVAAAVGLPERTGTVAAFAALMLTVILAVELIYLAFRLGAARTASGETGAALLASFGDDRHHVWFLIHMHLAYKAASGLALLGLVAVQVPRPDLGPRLLAGLGAAAALVSLAFPWATAYLPVDGELGVRRYWLWSIGGSGVGLAAGMVVLTVLGLAVGWRSRRVPLPLVLAAVVIGFVVFWGPLALDGAAVMEKQLAAQDPMSVPENAAPRFMEFAALLLSIAVVRTWWRGRDRRKAPAGPLTRLPQTVAGSPAWPTAR